MTKAEIFTDPAFLRLSEQQQAFVRALVENGGDKLAAAHEAYTCKDDFTARTMANRCLRKLQIKRLVDAYFGESLKDQMPSRDEAAVILWQRFQNAADDNAAHKWATLALRALGYDKEPAEEGPQKPAQSAQPQELDEDTLAEIQKRGLSNGAAK